MKRFLSGASSFLFSYIGLRDRKQVSSFVSHVILAPLWETLIFQTVLLGIPVTYVRQSWDVPWLPDPVFDRVLKWGAIAAAFLVSNFAFVTFHRPGHFGTFFLERRARKLLRRMEKAWVWERYSEALAPARDLLPAAEELWVREGREYHRFLQALALYVLLRCEPAHTPKHDDLRRETLEHILTEVRIYPNDILRSASF